MEEPKTLIVLSKYEAVRHAGEYYDEIVWVGDDPSTENIDGYASGIYAKIRELANGGNTVKIFCGAAPVFYSVLENLALKAGAEGISIELAWNKAK